MSLTVKIKEVSGIGNTFIANTIRNIDINLNTLFLSYSCCAPIGCAPSLINGTTHHHIFNIPTGRNFYKIPSDWKEKNASSIIFKHAYWRNIYIYSINGLRQYGWSSIFGFVQT